ncbi:T9SS type A sorting domain-containing protein [Weeksella virosa]|uniref:T9SS type A sorting domain-containing protein n=1 Tax=Weeksella virosa TaxID=1014 RepID=UPI0025529C74|nr:T9SS type A sorting domain-containing protein [Weeksella virosa]MDK7375413.1 T9SS type A sorting domain-containing protein [Weeksella virosa]
MKHFYAVLAFLFANLLTAQYYSFEQSENFNLGPVNEQNGWTVTKLDDGNPSLKQVVTEEKAKTGIRSLKIDYDPNAFFQPLLIMGAFKAIDQPLDKSNFTISFSANIGVSPGNASSDFGYQAGSRADGRLVNEIYFFYDGRIIILENAGEESNNKVIGNWSPHTWYDFKIVGDGDRVKYYLNGDLVHTGRILFNIDEIRFTHNNYSGFAYIDDVNITHSSMAVHDVAYSNETFLTPNPVSDFATIKIQSKVDMLSFFDLSGKKVIEVKPTSNTVDLSNLKAGIYYAVLKSGDTIVKQKIIKK